MASSAAGFPFRHKSGDMCVDRLLSGTYPGQGPVLDVAGGLALFAECVCEGGQWSQKSLGQALYIRGVHDVLSRGCSVRYPYRPR